MIISSIADINIIGSNDRKMIISGDEEYAEILKVDIYGNTVDIDHKSKLVDFDLKKNKDKVKIDIYVPFLYDLELETASNAFVAGFNSEDLNIRLSSAAQLSLEGNFDDLIIKLSGASHLRLRGVADRLYIDAGGSSRVDGFDLEAASGEIEASGATKVRVNASDYLTVDASGLSNVKYKGKAKISIDKSKSSTVSRY